jgi:GT2 family glycosyltransferase
MTKPGAFSERWAQLLSTCHLPRLVKAALPRPVRDAAHQLRVRALSCGLPRDRVFEQPSENRLASASMSIVVPIHDAPLVSLRCLTSLERYASKSQIILVDDGSRIAQTTHIIREFSSRNGWKVISNPDVRGHSAACAVGAGLASRPYLCLLNSDTVVTPWCWPALEQAFETDTTIGVAGPSTSSSRNEQTLNVAGHCRFYWNDSQVCAFAERLTIAPPQPVIIDLPWISGFAFLIRRSLWEELAGFDRNLPDYGNEAELCKRATKLGYRTVWVRSSYIHHLGQQSYGETIGELKIELRRRTAGEYIRNKYSERQR